MDFGIRDRNRINHRNAPGVRAFLVRKYQRNAKTGSASMLLAAAGMLPAAHCPSPRTTLYTPVSISGEAVRQHAGQSGQNARAPRYPDNRCLTNNV